MLGEMYEKGEVSHIVNESIKLYQQSAKRGYPLAKENLARLGLES